MNFTHGPESSESDSESVAVDSSAAGRICGALASETGRRIARLLREQPQTPSELADRLDVTTQNIHYHLDRLTDAGVVEADDTVYTENGNEVQLFRTASTAITLVFGRDAPSERSVDELGRLVGTVGVLSVGALLLRSSYLPVQDQTLTRPTPGFDPFGWLAVHPDVAFFLGGLLAVGTFVLLDRVREQLRESP